MKKLNKKVTVLGVLATLSCALGLVYGNNAQEASAETAASGLSGFDFPGASVFISTDDTNKQQMRFVLTLDETADEKYRTAAAEKTLQTGVVVLPYDLYKSAGLTELLKDTASAITADVSMNWEATADGYTTYAYLPANFIPQTQYNRMLTARGYIVDGDEVYYTDQIKASMAYVAHTTLQLPAYAKYEQQLKAYMGPYTMTYGEGAEEKLSGLYYGDKIKGLPAKKGGLPVNWYWDEQCKNPVLANDIATGNLTVYAKTSLVEDATSVELNEVVKTTMSNGAYTGNSVTLTSDSIGKISAIFKEDGTLLSEDATLTYDEIAGLSGQTKLIVASEEDNKLYTNASVLFVDGIVSTVADYTAMWTAAENLAAGTNTFGGYWKMGADIDVKDVTTLSSWCNGYNAQAQNQATGGWVGTFDGCGYTFKNVKAVTWKNSLFGVISGTVKNLGIKIETIDKGAVASAPLAFALSGTLENIYVSGFVNSAANANNPQSALVFRICSGAKMNNVYSNVECSSWGQSMVVAFGYMNKTAGFDVSGITNCFAVSPTKDMQAMFKQRGFDGAASDLADTSWYATQNVGLYKGASLAEAKAAFKAAQCNLNSFKADDIWITNGYNAPIFMGGAYSTEKTVVSTELDLGAIYEYMYNGSAFVANTELFKGGFEGTIVGVYSTTNENYFGGSLSYTDLNDDYFRIETTTHVYTRVKADIATGVIASVAEYTAMWTVAENLAADSNTFGGYWKMGADIDMKDVATLSSWCTNGYAVQDQKTGGWVGTFDGCGYTFKNVKPFTWKNSLFGVISGTVKNLGITLQANQSVASAPLAFALSGTLENIYVSGKVDSAQNNTNPQSALVYRILSGAKMNNIYSNVKCSSWGQTAVVAFGYMNVTEGFDVSGITNCFAVSPTNDMQAIFKQKGTDNACTDLADTSWYATQNVGLYKGEDLAAAEAAFKADTKKSTASFAVSEYWTVTDGVIAFKFATQNA